VLLAEGFACSLIPLISTLDGGAEHGIGIGGGCPDLRDKNKRQMRSQDKSDAQAKIE